MRKELKKIVSILAVASVVFSANPTQGVYAANGAEGRYKTESTVLQETQNTGEVPELQTEQFTEDAQLQADQGVEAVLISEQGPYYRPVSIDETVSDSIKESGEGGNKYYTFSLKESGRLDIRFVSHMSGYSVYLYDVNGTWIWESTSNGWNEATQMVSNTHTIDLMQGTYQMVVSGYKYWSPWGTGDFQFGLSFQSSGESYGKLHNSVSTAPQIAFGQRIYGQIAEIGEKEEEEYFRFSTPSAGRISIHITSYMPQYSIYFYDGTGAKVEEFTTQSWNQATGTVTNAYTIDLQKGDYYMIVNGYGYWRDWATGNFNFALTFADAGESFEEPNDSIRDSTRISIGQTIGGQLAKLPNDEKDRDFFVFTLNKTASINIKVTSQMPVYSMYIYDASGKEVKSFETNKWDETSRKVVNTHQADLPAGSYYIMFNGYGHWMDWSTGNYKFTVSYAAKSISAKLSKSVYTYDGKLKKPAAAVYANGKKLTEGRDYSLTYVSNKNPGQAKVKIELKGAY